MTEIRQITKDNAYDAVAPDDFPAMMEVDRYNARSTAFDKIISATHDHFWDPLDTKYIDFSEPFDLENQMVMPEEMVPELRLPCVQALDRKSQIKLANESARWALSSILHGEQGALNLSASLCHILRDPGAQEYAANQTREEARHVTAFAKYVICNETADKAAANDIALNFHEVLVRHRIGSDLAGDDVVGTDAVLGNFDVAGIGRPERCHRVTGNTGKKEDVVGKVLVDLEEFLVPDVALIGL